MPYGKNVINIKNVPRRRVYRELGKQFIATAAHLNLEGEIDWSKGMPKFGDQELIACNCKGVKDKEPWVRVSDYYILAKASKDRPGVLVPVRHIRKIFCAVCNRTIMEGHIDVIGFPPYLA